MTSETSSQINKVVDAQGLRCPMPLLKAKQALALLGTNELVRVIATDSGSVRDFHSFTDLTEHELVEFTENSGIYTYTIRKGSKK